MKKFLVVGNWKLNHGLSETRNFLTDAQPKVSHLDPIDIAVAPMAPLLMDACEKTRSSKISIAAQNVFYEDKGAFTGEWSAALIKEIGCAYCIVGHSERRLYFAESDESVGKKVAACLASGLRPIACVGESQEERSLGRVKDVLKRQIEAITPHIKIEMAERVAIAYEPIWAIGTGEVATKEQISEAHTLIREILSGALGKDSAAKIRLLYGGSVKADNAFAILSLHDVDGLLVGGASLVLSSFSDILEAAERAHARKAGLPISGL